MCILYVVYYKILCYILLCKYVQKVKYLCLIKYMYVYSNKKVINSWIDAFRYVYGAEWAGVQVGGRCRPREGARMPSPPSPPPAARLPDRRTGFVDYYWKNERLPTGCRRVCVCVCMYISRWWTRRKHTPHCSVSYLSMHLFRVQT